MCDRAQQVIEVVLVVAVVVRQAEGIDAWKETVLGYMPQLAPHLDHIKSMDDLIVASYSDTFMPKFHMGELAY